MRHACSLLLLILASAPVIAVPQPAQVLDARQQMARAIFKELIEIDFARISCTPSNA